MPHKVIIIGGDAAGMSTAAKLKRDLSETEVIVFEQGPDISYSACGMPYWIAGIIDKERKLIVMTPEVARERRGIDVRIHHKVTKIDPQAKTVFVENMQDGTTNAETYDYLVIATGARATRPPLDGLNASGIFTVRALNDGRRVYNYMAQHTVNHATIIGGGYIGVEMAEAMHERGISTTIVEMLPQLMPNFDADMVENMSQYMRDQGIDVRLEHQAERVTHHTGNSASRFQVHLTQSDEPLHTDLIIVATGVKPNAELAADAGLRLGKSGAIWVDRHMLTSDPHIYAAGDCVEHFHLVTGENAWIPLATSANKGGRLVGDNLVSRIQSTATEGFPGILGTAVVKVFEYTMSTTGLTEQAAKSSGLFGPEGEFVGSARIENYEKTGYWPGAEEIEVKLIFDKRTGRVLGGQLAGKAGINKRIDIIATAITAGMTLEQVSMLDLSYAPPYSPTYDPIQICANVGRRAVDPALRFADGEHQSKQ